MKCEGQKGTSAVNECSMPNHHKHFMHWLLLVVVGARQKQRCHAGNNQEQVVALVALALLRANPTRMLDV